MMSLKSYQRQLTDDGCEPYEAWTIMAAEGHNPEFHPGTNAICEAMAGDGTQRIPHLHKRDRFVELDEIPSSDGNPERLLISIESNDVADDIS